MRDHEIKNGDQEKVLAVLAYLGILVLVPIFMGKKSKYVRFHSNQGLILLIGEVVWWAVRSFLGIAILSISWRLYFLSNILDMVSILFLKFSRYSELWRLRPVLNIRRLKKQEDLP